MRHRCLGTRLEDHWNWKCLFCGYEFNVWDEEGRFERISTGAGESQITHFGGAGGLEMIKLPTAFQSNDAA